MPHAAVTARPDGIVVDRSSVKPAVYYPEGSPEPDTAWISYLALRAIADAVGGTVGDPHGVLLPCLDKEKEGYEHDGKNYVSDIERAAREHGCQGPALESARRSTEIGRTYYFDRAAEIAAAIEELKRQAVASA